MKTLQAIILLKLACIVNVQSFAQSNDLEWAPIGATWTYIASDFSGGGDRPFTITSLRDTLIEGKSCRYLANEYGSREIILYEENDTVYTYQNNQFGILYDFTAQPGDTVDVPYMGCPNNVYQIQIDSVGAILLGNDSLRVQWLTIPEDPFGDCPISFGVTLVEKVGGLGFLLPQDILADPPISSGLVSYSDNRCNLFYFDEMLADCVIDISSSISSPLCAFQSACDTVVSTKNLLKNLNEIKIYPSPAQNHIILQSTTDKFLFGKVTMYDLTGKIVTFIKHDKAREAIIEVSHLKNGIYFLQVEIDGKLYSEKIQISR